MSALEAEFAWQAHVANLPPHVAEYRFSPPRRWRFDFAWPDHLLAVELEGGTYTRGRHVRPQGFEADCEKYNAAVLAGWRVLRFTRKMLQTGAALACVESALGGVQEGPDHERRRGLH